MGESIRQPLNFGPSERYLPGLKEGEALTFKLLDIGVDVDTEFGQKLQFSLDVINVLTTSSSSLKAGKYVWNTTCRAAKDLHEYFVDNETKLDAGPLNLDEWTFTLTAEEYGYRITEVD
jgi:hypothetical protein